MASLPDTASVPPPAGPRRTPGDEYPRWPLWGPLAAIAVGLPIAFVVVGTVGAVANLDAKSPWLTSLTALVLDLSVVAAAFGVARLAETPRAWQFGLRRAPLGRSIGFALAAVAVFFAFSAVYSAALQPHNPQTIVDDLGANNDTALLVIGGLVVIVVAPLCEELFFRGFLFRILRVRTTFWLAALADGVIFGLVHGSLIIAPVLAVLGLALCWVYERTGSLFPCIAIHALNNTIAYGATTDNGWVAAGAIGATMLVACAAAPALLPRAAPATA
ncbi:MAG: protease family protein [Thermoleophilaceae bacterium]|nr:protease family protein [Thermoleophilaceae bacterium]